MEVFRVMKATVEVTTLQRFHRAVYQVVEVVAAHNINGNTAPMVALRPIFLVQPVQLTTLRRLQLLDIIEEAQDEVPVLLMSIPIR